MTDKLKIVLVLMEDGEVDEVRPLRGDAAFVEGFREGFRVLYEKINTECSRGYFLLPESEDILKGLLGLDRYNQILEEINNA